MLYSKIQYVKKYVIVGAYHTPEGKTIPKFLIIDDEHKTVFTKGEDTVL